MKIYKKEIFIIISLFLVAVYIIKPNGEYLYGQDDWSYAWAVFNLHYTGKLILSNWAAPNALPQIFLGNVLVKMFGFNLEILNFSIIFFTIITLILFFELCKIVLKNRTHAFFATILFISSPIFLGFSFTFSSDMPFLAALLISVFFFIKYFNSNSKIYLIIAIIFTLISILTRQIGVVLLIAFFFILILKQIEIYKTESKILYFDFLIGIIMPLIFTNYFKFYPKIFGQTTIAQKIISENGKSIFFNFIYLHRFLSFFVMSLVYNIFLICPFLSIIIINKYNLIISSIKKYFYKFILLLLTTILIMLFWSFKINPLITPGDLFQMKQAYKINNYDNDLVSIIFIIYSGFLFSVIIFFFFIRIIERKINLSFSNLSLNFIFFIFFLMISIISISPTYFNNYFLSTLPFFIILIFFFLKEFNFNTIKFKIVYILMLIYSIIYYENHVRSIQAAWNLSDKYKRRNLLIYSLPSWYAWNNYYLINKEFIKKYNNGDGLKTFGIFHDYYINSDYHINRNNELIIYDTYNYKSLFKDQKFEIIKSNTN